MKKESKIVALVLKQAEKNASTTLYKKSSPSHKAKFLTLKKDIETLVLEHQLPLSFVWKTLKENGSIDCCYLTFTRYFKMYVTQSNEHLSKSKQKTPYTKKKHIKNREPIIASAEPVVFHYNPNPNIKDLL